LQTIKQVVLGGFSVGSTRVSTVAWDCLPFRDIFYYAIALLSPLWLFIGLRPLRY